MSRQAGTTSNIELIAMPWAHNNPFRIDTAIKRTQLMRASFGVSYPGIGQPIDVKATTRKLNFDWQLSCHRNPHLIIAINRVNALLNLFLTLVDPGKNVLLPEPYFPLYGPDVTLCGGESRYYPCLFENEFVPRIEDLESQVDENTVAILYNFPSNPTGGTLTIEQRDELLDFAKRNNLWILSDEVYDRIVFDAEHVSFVGTEYDKVMLINSFSNTFAMTG